ncbi:hypothetical protein [Streptomyces sp. NPDC006285]|uniref:hypothetical protein n=1 Tax=Streptomyces sp. NPDC006285 TaxID=3364742 RepID=UPI00368A4997
MTTHITDRSSAQPVGPPPAFDPELVPVIEVPTSLRSPDAYRSDNIVEMRKPVPGVETPTPRGSVLVSPHGCLVHRHVPVDTQGL